MPSYRPDGKEFLRLRLRTGMSQDELADRLGTSKSQVAKAEKGSADDPMTTKSLDAFGNFYEVEWKLLIHPEDPYWEGRDKPSSTAIPTKDIQNEGIYRRIPTTTQGLLEGSDTTAPQAEWTNNLQASKELLAAFQATINASQSPMGFLAHNQRVTLYNDALKDFFSDEELAGLTLKELGDMNNQRLVGESVDIDKLHQSFRDKAADGPYEILKYIGNVDFRSSPSGRWSSLYEQRLSVWSVWEQGFNVGSMFHYILSEKDSTTL